MRRLRKDPSVNPEAVLQARIKYLEERVAVLERLADDTTTALEASQAAAVRYHRQLTQRTEYAMRGGAVRMILAVQEKGSDTASYIEDQIDILELRAEKDPGDVVCRRLVGLYDAMANDIKGKAPHSELW